MRRIVQMDRYDSDSLIYVVRGGLKILEVFDKNIFGEHLEVSFSRTFDNRIVLRCQPYRPYEMVALCEDV